MVAALMVTADDRDRRGCCRGSARGRWCPPGCCSPRSGMLLPDRRRPSHSSYAARRPARPARHGRRHGLIFAPAMSLATLGVAPQRRRRRLGDGQHVAADRRLDRHRAAEHARRLVDRAAISAHTARRRSRRPRPRSPATALRSVGGGHLRRRRDPDGSDPARRRAGFRCGAGARSSRSRTERAALEPSAFPRTRCPGGGPRRRREPHQSRFAPPVTEQLRPRRGRARMRGEVSRRSSTRWPTTDSIRPRNCGSVKRVGSCAASIRGMEDLTAWEISHRL